MRWIFTRTCESEISGSLRTNFVGGVTSIGCNLIYWSMNSVQNHVFFNKMTNKKGGLSHGVKTESQRTTNSISSSTILTDEAIII